MNFTRLKEIYSKLPKTVKSFLFRALVLFIAWQLLNNFVLVPTRVPDQALTNFTGYSTAKVFSLFYDHITIQLSPNNTYRIATIFKDGQKLIGIGDPCNALDIFVLYSAFLLCYPGSAKRRLVFTLCGGVVIYVFNIIRCVFLAWMTIVHPGWVDISHHYIFTTVMYIIVFFGWVLYTKKGAVHEG